MKDVFDSELNEYLESTESYEECYECGGEVEEGKEYCSERCYKSSLR